MPVGRVILTSYLTAEESVEFVLFCCLKVTQQKIGFGGDVHRTRLEIELYNLDQAVVITTYYLGGYHVRVPSMLSTQETTKSAFAMG